MISPAFVSSRTRCSPIQIKHPLTVNSPVPNTPVILNARQIKTNYNRAFMKYQICVMVLHWQRPMPELTKRLYLSVLSVGSTIRFWRVYCGSELSCCTSCIMCIRNTCILCCISIDTYIDSIPLYLAHSMLYFVIFNVKCDLVKCVYNNCAFVQTVPPPGTTPNEELSC